MDSRNLNIYVKMLLECDEIDKRIREFDITEERWRESRAMRDLVLMPLLQIGELTTHFKDSSYQTEMPDVPWREIKGFRNVVVHGYGHIDPSIAWNTATMGVVELRSALLGNDEIKTEYDNELSAGEKAGEGLLDLISSLPNEVD